MNPLNALGVRELNHLPVHFVKTTISSYDKDPIKNWVTQKLSGRFCILDTPTISDKNKLTSATTLAFENHQELTYFMLACPYLRR